MSKMKRPIHTEVEVLKGLKAEVLKDLEAVEKTLAEIKEPKKTDPRIMRGAWRALLTLRGALRRNIKIKERLLKELEK